MRKKYDYKAINRQNYFTNKRCQVGTRHVFLHRYVFHGTYLFLFYFIVAVLKIHFSTSSTTKTWSPSTSWRLCLRLHMWNVE